MYSNLFKQLIKVVTNTYQNKIYIHIKLIDKTLSLNKTTISKRINDV